MHRPPLNGKKAEKTNIVLPSALKKAAQKLAAARRISLSQLVTQLLARASEEPS
jgi:uncharacterized protein (DUF1778 family)